MAPKLVQKCPKMVKITITMVYVYGNICLNDIIIGAPKDSRGSRKVQVNIRLTFGPNSILEVWLKMAQTSKNERLSIV